MDPFFLMVFTFVLLMTLLVGGFIVIFPLSRRLGAYLEMQIERRRDRPEDAQRLEELQQAIRELGDEVGRLRERQAFTEALLAGQGESRLLTGDPDPERTESEV